MRQVLEPQERNGKWFVEYLVESGPGKGTKILIEADSERECFKKIQAEDAAQAARVSLAIMEAGEDNKFLANHKHDYLPNEANARVLLGYLQEKGLSRTAANLEIAYQECVKAKKLSLPERVAEEVQETPPPPPPIEVPWKTPLTYEDIRNMPREEYRSYLKNKDEVLRGEFVRQLAEIGIQTAGR